MNNFINERTEFRILIDDKIAKNMGFDTHMVKIIDESNQEIKKTNAMLRNISIRAFKLRSQSKFIFLKNQELKVEFILSDKTAIDVPVKYYRADTILENDNEKESIFIDYVMLFCKGPSHEFFLNLLYNYIKDNNPTLI